MTAGFLRLGKSLRFLMVGGVNTAFGLAFYPLLLWTVPLHYMAALGIAQVVCLCFAFTTYKLAVFRTRGNLLREFATFASFYLANYAANWLALPLLVEVGGVPPIVAQTGFTIVVIVGSWYWHNRVTFRERAAR
ncbi:MAG: GtrA family protein [Sphingopyxis sp.]|nr:GtrA family protein [Sphingopyxis sp.]